MTKQEANDWLKQVKGKKIRRSSWDEDMYVIPSGEWGDTSDIDPSRWTFLPNRNPPSPVDFPIFGGYEVDEGFNLCDAGVKWVLVETFDDYLERYYND